MITSLALMAASPLQREAIEKKYRITSVSSTVIIVCDYRVKSKSLKTYVTISRYVVLGRFLDDEEARAQVSFWSYQASIVRAQYEAILLAYGESPYSYQEVKQTLTEEQENQYA